jgi:hypothetical protein
MLSSVLLKAGSVYLDKNAPKKVTGMPWVVNVPTVNIPFAIVPATV